MAALRLILLRHGEAMMASVDFARELTETGKRDAKRVGRELKARAWIPEIAIVSDARRAQSTCDLLELSCTREDCHDLYLCGVDVLLDRLSGRSEACVLAVGHNPAWTQALYHLSGDLRPLLPANAALLEIEAATWAEAIAKNGCWSLSDVVD